MNATSITRTAALAAIAATLATASVTAQELNNEGLIEQTVELRGSVSLTQDLTEGSLQGANVVGARDTLNNTGTIRQTLIAEEAELTQDSTVDSTQCLNCVVAGNPTF